jgi:hypothetical protein
VDVDLNAVSLSSGASILSPEANTAGAGSKMCSFLVRDVRDVKQMLSFTAFTGKRCQTKAELMTFGASQIYLEIDGNVLSLSSSASNHGERHLAEPRRLENASFWHLIG